MPTELNYAAQAIAHEGAPPRVSTSDERIDLELSTPEELAGAGGPGTNAEQLLAAGYAACLLSALRLAALKQGVSIEGADVRCTLNLTGQEDRFDAAVTLEADIPSVPEETARALLDTAMRAWPFAADRGARLPQVGLSGAPRGGGEAPDLQVRQEAAEGGGYT